MKDNDGVEAVESASESRVDIVKSKTNDTDFYSLENIDEIDEHFIFLSR